MGVIGRLDDQVNDIIIKPVGERRRPPDEETKTPAAENATRPQTRTEERVQDDESAKQEQPELPVWLL